MNLEAAKTSHSEFRCATHSLRQLCRSQPCPDWPSLMVRLPSLFPNSIELSSASAHRRVMREHGVKVLTVRDILSYGVEDHVGARVELEDLAMKVGKGYQRLFEIRLLVLAHWRPL